MADTTAPDIGTTLRRADIISAHGDTFNGGRDNCGHITLDDGSVVLLVTENGHHYGTQGLAQGLSTEHPTQEEHEYCWTSQRATTAGSKRGRQIIHAGPEGTTVHLWTRTRKAHVAFSYRGTVTYVSHHGEAPMAVSFALDAGVGND